MIANDFEGIPIKVMPPLECAAKCEKISQHQGKRIYSQLKRRLPPTVFSQLVGAVSAGVMDALPRDVVEEQKEVITTMETEFFCNVVPEQRHIIGQSLAQSHWQAIRTEMLLSKVQDTLQ